ncbi:MAG: hypothetical protein ACJ8J3_09035, partial [Burkholderia ambifaria]
MRRSAHACVNGATLSTRQPGASASRPALPPNYASSIIPGPKESTSMEHDLNGKAVAITGGFGHLGVATAAWL